ncbi:DEAD/DEAH box helicase [Pararhodobacter oceanensis]|uniref:DEAD/DEAH box helicase n=1 Tax=Pararhodobacter oceanensis TaxID=2172121 RepID=UPI003A937A07
MTDFSMLGLIPSLPRALERMGLTAPTPIQARSIPAVMEGRDLLGLAQTGTGKTLAFGLPIVHALDDAGKPDPKTARALILAPTRELVNQIADSLTTLTNGLQTSVVKVVGGASLNRQSDRLARGCDILVATPGRLIDLLERRAVTLNQVRMLVLDEADQMLDLGFVHALRKISRYLPEERQTLLFSATMSSQMNEIAETFLNHPVKVQVSPSGKAADKVEQAVHYVAQGDKPKLLETYLREHPEELALVFSRTKHGAEKLSRLLASWGFEVASIHGNKSQGQRERALAAFRSGETKVLVATDVAARGLDIPLVRHVYNLDLPNVPENYIHRIGRTARAGRDGRAVAFCAPAEVGDLRAIETLLRQKIEVIGGEEWPRAMAEEARAEARKQTGGRGRPASRKGAVTAKSGKPGGGSKAKKPGLHPAYAEEFGGNKQRRRGPGGGAGGQRRKAGGGRRDG